MEHRRSFLARSGLALAGLAGPALGQPLPVRERLPDGSASRDMINEPAQKAINQGLAFLAQHRHEDGYFGTGQYRGNVAITSLAALAMMSGGHLPGRGLYGDIVSRALRFVMEQEEKHIPGYLHNRNASPHGPMYGHGFGTLFLAEVYGTVTQPKLAKELRELLKRAVLLILASQNNEGGWRYKPGDKDADISVTICQIMALRAARNAGIDVPKEKVDKCIDYVKNCQDLRGGGFRYMAQSGQTAFARTAAGVAALLSAGIYKGEEVTKGLEYLMHFKPNQPRLHQRHYDMHYFYGHYYAAMAMWTVGGTYWSEWYPAIRDDLIQRVRNRDGWFDSICSHYGTAMACIILQIPNNYLPILQT